MPFAQDMNWAVARYWTSNPDQRLNRQIEVQSNRSISNACEEHRYILALHSNASTSREYSGTSGSHMLQVL